MKPPHTIIGEMGIMDKVIVKETDGETEEQDRRVSRNGKLAEPVKALPLPHDGY